MAHIDLKDLAPLLLKKESVGGDVDPSLLAPLLNSGEQINTRRKELLRLMESHPALKDRDMMYHNHTESYNHGVKKAFHYIQFLKEHNITLKKEAEYVYYALGEQSPVGVHIAMFIPTLENQADDEQQKKWLPLAQSFQIIAEELNSVCVKLQYSRRSLAEVRALFDAFVDKYPVMAEHLKPAARVVHSPVFEAAVVKMTRGHPCRRLS